MRSSLLSSLLPWWGFFLYIGSVFLVKCYGTQWHLLALIFLSLVTIAHCSIVISTNSTRILSFGLGSPSALSPLSISHPLLSCQSLVQWLCTTTSGFPVLYHMLWLPCQLNWHWTLNTRLDFIQLTFILPAGSSLVLSTQIISHFLTSNWPVAMCP